MTASRRLGGDGAAKPALEPTSAGQSSAVAHRRLVAGQTAVSALEAPSLAPLQIAPLDRDLGCADTEGSAALPDSVMATGDLAPVVVDILSVRDFDQVLLSIARHALTLFGSDIAGVLLRDDDHLMMRSCVGHRRAQTAQLCIQLGQGVAGRVLETGAPYLVDTCWESAATNQDADLLTSAEETHWALGTPLTVQGDVIGVLEVWRRNHLSFHDGDVRRIGALAGLAAIAIENARLYASQQAIARQLSDAEATLSQQLTTVTEAHSLQCALIRELLEGDGLPGVIRTVAQQMGGDVALLSPELEPIAVYPRGSAIDDVRFELRRYAREGNIAVDSFTIELSSGRWLTVRDVRAGPDSFGWLCLLAGRRPGGGVEAAVGEAALCCALSQLEQRAVDRALSQAREQVVWDLLEAVPEQRRMALSRAARLGVDVSRPHRVLHGVVEDLSKIARAEGWDTSRVDRLSRQILGMVRRVIVERGGGNLVAVRGDTVTAIVSCTEPVAVRQMIRALWSEARRLVPGITTAWGVSGIRLDLFDLRTAYSEAQVALRAAQRLDTGRLALHDDLGVIRLLLTSDTETNLQAFMDDVIGPIVEYDRRHDGELLTTLRAYFDADCSQQAAAKQLQVHHKTLRYRLGKIEALTSLNLHRHDDRVRADLGLKIHQLANLGALDPEDR